MVLVFSGPREAAWVEAERRPKLRRVADQMRKAH
jgi:hypothetical protein